MAPETATKHASYVAVSSQQQQLAAIVSLFTANNNFDVSEYTVPQLLNWFSGFSATAKNDVAEKSQHQLNNCGTVYSETSI